MVKWKFMARILFIYKQFPAPSVGHAGGESLFRLMEAMRRRGHRLSLVARILDEERALLPHVEAICERVYTVPHHRALPGPRPLALIRSYLALRGATARALRELHPDFVHVETTQTAVILLGMRLPRASFRTQDVNWFLQAQKAAHTRGLRWLWDKAIGAFYRGFEPALYRRYAVCLAISEGDRALLTAACPTRPWLLLPLAPAVSPDPQIVPAVPAGPNLLFVGAMGRDHNIAGVSWFLNHVWPRIRAAVPEARFYIVGGSPPVELQACADGEHCFVTGFVEDLAPWYRAAAVFVSPMLVAGGLLQKILDAMALGVPVVATSACNHGIGATPGEHLLTADTPETFADAVIALLRDPEARARLGAAGQQFIHRYYDIETAVDQWEAALLKSV
ncbi:MAG TPA: glycosyltransferase [Anaerolineae bacterium]|nr:glycosyltransferase [Anaerolineae bacterium]HQK15000.1 glycosyltransferase [Anaerolineae bacterium]